MVHPEDRERVRGTILQQRSNARPYDDLYYRVVRPDGETMHVWARGSYICDETGRAVRAVGLIEDVTARVQAEEALRRSETVLQTIMAASATNLALFDRDHRCLFANYTLHGAPVEEIIGKRIYEYIPAPVPRAGARGVRCGLATGRGADTENEMLMEGHTVAAPVRDAAAAGDGRRARSSAS